MVDRRRFLGIAAGAGASLTFTPQLLRALQQAGAPLIQRAIPSSGEMLPAVGLSFSNHASCADPAALKAVLKAFADNGGRVFDAMHGSASSGSRTSSSGRRGEHPAPARMARRSLARAP